MKQHNPPHPGVILNDVFLEGLDLSVTAAAARLKVSRKHLSQVVHGRAGVTPEMALRLELAFGKSVESWLGHQADYDLWQLEGRRESLGVERLAA